MADRLLIASGDVVEVQLTSETVVVENESRRGGLRALSTGRISNRMRVFVREEDGKERAYDFEGARIGLHDGHRCAVVRGRCPGAKDPVNLMLVNISTDERDVFENGLAAYLHRKPFFGPAWKAFGLSALMVPFGIFYSQIVLGHSDTLSVWGSFWWALFFAFLAYPIFWILAKLWDDFRARGKYKQARKLLLADIEGRLRAHTRAAPAA